MSCVNVDTAAVLWRYESVVWRNPVSMLRRIALAEAISFLLLLGIGMPAKYAAGVPEAVKVFGWLHGVLFVALCVALLRVVVVARWPLSRAGAVFVASLLPFGPFVIDRRMLDWQRQQE